MKQQPVTSEELIRLARTKCLLEAPYIAPALSQMPLVITDRVPTAAVSNSGVIYFNPQFAEELHNEANGQLAVSVARLAFIVYHEVMHFVRGHAERAPQPMNAATQALWNIAADCEINDHIPKGTEMPAARSGEPIGVLPSSYNLPNGQLAEWYYEQLKQNGAPIASLAIGGSGADGVRREWEEEKENAPALSSAEKELVREGVARAVLEHEKQAGNLPPGLVRWAQAELEKRVDWRKQLRHIVGKRVGEAQLARQNYTFRKPNRRYSGSTNVILPSLKQNTTPNIAVVVDTSGSVSTEELRYAVGEILNIIQTFQTEVVVVPCDAEAYEATKVRSRRDFKTDTLKGGGGTNMTVGIQAAKEHKPDAIVVITDGYTPYPSEADKQVVWCIYGHGSEPPTPPTPPWRTEQIVRVRLDRK